MDDMEFTRRLILTKQGLYKKNQFGRGISGTLKAIKNIGYVQIDSISVVERAHHHVLWSRVPDYKTSYLNQLQKEKKVFEYWSHAAAYIPIEDYRYCLPRMLKMREGSHWFSRDKKLMDEVLHRIKVDGPLMSKDFETTKTSGKMWDIKPVKRAIHELFQMGKLVVKDRVGFHKIYDLPERFIPNNIITSMPTIKEFTRYIILTSINAQGIVNKNEICYLRKGIKKDIEIEIKYLLVEGIIKELNFLGRNYLLMNDIEIKLPIRPNNLRVEIISPFDNSIIQRDRLFNFFNFEYKTEIYLPKEKRTYGYFTLPILWGSRFVGRLNPKADRKNKVLLIDNLILHNSLDTDEKFMNELLKRIKDFASFNSCIKVIFLQKEFNYLDIELI